MTIRVEYKEMLGFMVRIRKSGGFLVEKDVRSGLCLEFSLKLLVFVVEVEL